MDGSTPAPAPSPGPWHHLGPAPAPAPWPDPSGHGGGGGGGGGSGGDPGHTGSYMPHTHHKTPKPYAKADVKAYPVLKAIEHYSRW